jgi:aminoglycoside phosphotransferase (APT) family kinase protein
MMSDEERLARMCAIFKRDLRNVILDISMAALADPASDKGKAWRQFAEAARMAEYVDTVQRILGI